MSGNRVAEEDCLKLGGDGAMGRRRLGLGALLVALRKLHARCDEGSGRASPHIVIEARNAAEAHATLRTMYNARRVGARLGADKTYTALCEAHGAK